MIALYNETSCLMPKIKVQMHHHYTVSLWVLSRCRPSSARQHSTNCRNSWITAGQITCDAADDTVADLAVSKVNARASCPPALYECTRNCLQLHLHVWRLLKCRDLPTSKTPLNVHVPSSCLDSPQQCAASATLSEF